MKILAAANNIAMLEDLKKKLSDFSAESEIIKESDALMAGKYAFNHKVDIVFAEAEMKRMNGLQLIEFVRHEHPDVKSFLIGSEKELSESFLDISEDVTGVLPYPFAENAIEDALQKSGQHIPQR